MTSASPRPNLAIAAYRQLKRDIIRGVYAPGEKLRMSHLKERYALGVGPMREALSQLVGERLVTAVKPGNHLVVPRRRRSVEAKSGICGSIRWVGSVRRRGRWRLAFVRIVLLKCAPGSGALP